MNRKSLLYVLAGIVLVAVFVVFLSVAGAALLEQYGILETVEHEEVVTVIELVGVREPSRRPGDQATMYDYRVRLKPGDEELVTLPEHFVVGDRLKLNYSKGTWTSLVHVNAFSKCDSDC